jgi:hypothetical protein
MSFIEGDDKEANPHKRQTRRSGLAGRVLAAQRLATYIVISKPKRKSVALGVSQVMAVSFAVDNTFHIGAGGCLHRLPSVVVCRLPVVAAAMNRAS